MTKQINASDHESHGAFTILALLIPFVGFLLGLVYLTKDKTVDRKLGEHTLVMSIIGFVAWWVLFAVTAQPAYY